jgi:hypothetical protein
MVAESVDSGRERGDTDTFGGALRYPMRGEDARDGVAFVTAMALAVALTGRYAAAVFPGVAALAFLALAGVAAVAWLGYLGRILTGTVDADLASGDGVLVATVDAGRMPAVGSPRELIATGVRVALASTPYVLAPFVLLYVTILGLGNLSADAVSGGGGIALLAGGTISFLLALAFVYVLPAALCELAATGSVRRALAPWLFRDVLAHAAYLYAWTAAFSLGILALAAYGQVVSGAGILGLVAALAAGYVSAIAARLSGMGYRRARRR